MWEITSVLHKGQKILAIYWTVSRNGKSVRGRFKIPQGHPANQVDYSNLTEQQALRWVQEDARAQRQAKRAKQWSPRELVVRKRRGIPW